MRRSSTLWSMRYAADPVSVARAREDVVAQARDGGLAPERLEDLRLVVSEAVSNAVRHGYGDGRAGEVSVTVMLGARTLRVRVGDSGCGPGSAGESTGLGLGLALISELADEFAMRPALGGGTELTVGFMLDAVDACEVVSRGAATWYAGAQPAAAA